MIHEDPDELGYFFDFPLPKFPRDEVWDECNRMLSREDQQNIKTAADLAHRGLGKMAERFRSNAGYGGVPE